MPVKYDLPFTQTSHLIALGSTTLLVGVAIFPFGASWSGSGGNQGAWPVIVRVVHLGSFSGWFGTQLWVTFFAGLTMYKHLPRHTFGYIQSKLFPKYFLFGAVLSSLSIATYLVENPIHSWGLQESVQVSIDMFYDNFKQ
ncbi:PREDICTED: transmembrane protein 205-like [Amphimedon queenslandica]|uniref:TMEM205-like domain-containing protein n=1 Tax=Amphimedon queenslandica TaxID=400682 RepID=A0AAN0ILW4_AMPQE|nr:PREDICTED: transmembrane protein 205-like [Amphimedon queenslandica]|eukprot:XP_011404217.1 PREDICTED: transmembrane protein 205-like [Amphimedon queenslandica]